MKPQLINSFAHACEVLGQTIDLEKLRSAGLPEADVQPMIDDYKIKKIVEASNKLNNWKADWSDTRQWKYSIYKGIEADSTKPSGFGFSRTCFDYWLTYADVGSRLVVGTSEEALHIGKQFEDLFESAWLIIEPK